jgi:hypothetical protein
LIECGPILREKGWRWFFDGIGGAALLATQTLRFRKSPIVKKETDTPSRTSVTSGKTRIERKRWVGRWCGDWRKSAGNRVRQQDHADSLNQKLEGSLEDTDLNVKNALCLLGNLVISDKKADLDKTRTTHIF